ncbi:transcriptional regulator family: Zinc finger MIZ-type [Penicillium odoratum]|uniref:transcriptional regulator family: Zinc finger MIZ-type n=1 Tax=Penicillium odoratum TaxID=1167516 RepID=UPI002548A3BA|nr:transcriptional regulator family: Zinc finger MIZ-type [Penicillium odoratum]KAJ5751841.1 transcriptional regulator family: Zinc finger MIZ-type [Penicillium odoratum]
MSPVTPGDMLQSVLSSVPVTSTVTAPKQTDPPTAALPSPVPSADSHLSPVISNLSAVASPAITSPAIPAIPQLHTQIPTPTSVTNETASPLPSGMSRVPQDSAGTTSACSTTPGRTEVPPRPMQGANGTQLAASDDLVPDRYMWKKWMAWVDQVKTHAAAAPSIIAIPRVQLLYDACVSQDLFYLALHQVFCRISVGGKVFLDLPELNSEGCRRGLNRVAELLQSNANLPKEMVVAFAQFPVMPDDVKEHGWYQLVLLQVVAFLPLLATRFPSQNCPFYSTVSSRRFMPLVHEMKTEFELNSPVFMSVIYASMARQLYDTWNLEALNTLFRRNLMISDKESLHKLIDEYRSIPMKAPNSQQTPLPSPHALALSQVQSRPKVTRANTQPSESPMIARVVNQDGTVASNGLQSSNGPARQSSVSQPPAQQLAQDLARQPPPMITAPTYQIPYIYPSEMLQRQQMPQMQRQQPQHPQPPQPPQQPQKPPHPQQSQHSHMMAHQGMAMAPQQMQAWPISNHAQMSPMPGHVPGNPWNPPNFQEFSGSCVPPSAYSVSTPLNSAQNGARPVVSSPSTYTYPSAYTSPSPLNPTRQNGIQSVASGDQRRGIQGPSQNCNQGTIQTYQTYLRNQPIGSPRQAPAPSQSNVPLVSSASALLPDHGYRIPQTSHPNPMRTGLHQADLRDPVKKCVKKGPGGEMREAELYHYVSDFALEPTLTDPNGYNYVWVFPMSAEDITRRPRLESPIQEGHRPIITYQSGCRTLRLRCVALPASAAENAKTLWHTAPTSWPSVFYIHLNGRELTPRRKAHNGKDLPLDITSDVHQGDNKLQIDLLLGPDECKDIRYYFGVEAMDVSRFDLVRSLVKAIPAELVRQKISKRLSPSAEDDDVAVVSNNLTVSLIDPFTAQVFRTPARSSLCEHQECFDLETFIKTRKSVSGLTAMNDNWRCPICNSDARPQLLVLDRFLEDVRAQLIQTNKLEGAQAITIQSDGSWTVKATGDEATPSPQKTKRSVLAKRKAEDPALSGNVTSRLKYENPSSPEIPKNQERVVIEID